MSPAEHDRMTARVVASEHLSDTPAERHGVYARRALVPEANAEPAIHVESFSESTPATPHKPGSDGRGSGSSPIPRVIPGTRRLA